MTGIVALIPSISIVSLALLSLFTIGYFSKIGLHFLGLVDVTNVVYSFGLTFGLVTTFVAFANADTHRWFKREAETGHLLPFLLAGWRYVGLPLAIISFVLHTLPTVRYLPEFVGSDGFMVLVLMLGSLWLLAIVVARHVAEDEREAAEVSGFAAFLLLLIYCGGRYQAEIEVFSPSKPLYDISLKSSKPQPEGSVSTIKDVRIVRSSSSGFVIAIDGYISFLPKDEVTMVQAQKPVLH